MAQVYEIFETDQMIILVMEYASGGELFGMLSALQSFQLVTLF
jgi:serine/threonine protein kinase